MNFQWIVLAVLSAALVTARVSHAAPAIASQEQIAPYSIPQQLVHIEKGRIINLVCLGRGSPTVILTAGLGEWSLTWRLGSGSFSYDALGRRTGSSIGGSANSYSYDGLNLATINGDFMLDGLGLDETYARVNSAGTTSYVADALGSTIALTSGSGATTASYSYEPYGNTTKAGSDDSVFQFTGRENDEASNLYYYRARYYSPQLGRFISQDPTGFTGGLNWYAYVGGNPISNSDPLGLYAMPWHGFISFIALTMSGVDPLTASLTAGTDMGFDFSPGSQNPANANWHSMATPGQSKACARAGAQNFINSQVASGNLIGLGAALHTNEDSLARGHAYSVWDGHLTMQHFLAEPAPIRGKRNGEPFTWPAAARVLNSAGYASISVGSGP